MQIESLETVRRMEDLDLGNDPSRERNIVLLTTPEEINNPNIIEEPRFARIIDVYREIHKNHLRPRAVANTKTRKVYWINH